MKFLIIDDTKNITVMLSKMLKMEGYECVTSNDGRTGLSLIEREKFDAVLLDLAMPEFSGLDVIDALGKSGKIKEQKIIVLTASSPPDDTLSDLKARGVYTVLKKPIDLDVLLDILKN